MDDVEFKKVFCYVEPEMRSPKSFAIILSALDKFYPNLKKEAESDFSHKELNELEAVLA